MISQETIQKVFDISNVKEIMEGYGFSFKRSGHNYRTCCPFHSERTPSFTVGVGKEQYFYCFGCGKGGNAITFLMEHQQMTYVAAIEFIAKKYGVPIKYETTAQTEEQQKAAKLRESRFLALEAVQKFFVEQFNNDTAEAKATRDYAYTRWSEEFCRAYGIGLAPKDSRIFFEYVKTKHIPYEILKDVGIICTDIEHHRDYPLFRNRLTIPIYNRFRKVIGYTARTLEHNEQIAKYINSTNSEIYDKGKSIFGIHVAMRQAVKVNHFILVEGAPDVLRLHSLGLTQAVAALGTSWTNEHLELLHTKANTLCFIPDGDVPKDKTKLAPGFASVCRSGEHALRMGFNVYVRQLPIHETEKRDADSYIQSIDIYAALKEELFVVWYARVHFAIISAESQKQQLVTKIGELLNLIKDANVLDETIDQLAQITGKVRTWKEAQKKQAIIKKKEEADKAAAAVDPTSIAAIARRYGIIMKDNQYYKLGEGDDRERWSNFIMEPVFHIRDMVNASRVYRITNTSGDTYEMEFRQEELCTLSRFQQRIESVGNFMWQGNMKNLNVLKEVLYSKGETADRISILGWNKTFQVYAFGNGVYYDGKFLPVDDLGLVRAGGNILYLPAYSRMHKDDEAKFSFEREMSHFPTSNITLKAFLDEYIGIFGDNAKVAFAYLLCAIFRDVVFSYKSMFPILNLFGPHGSGKTTLLTAIRSFFVATEKNPSSLLQTTLPSMNYVISNVVNGLTLFDEYKNDIDPRIVNFLKDAWGGTGKLKMAGDNFGKPVQIIFTTAIAFCGQEKPDIDIALFSRCIHLSYNKNVFDPDAKQRFNNFKKLCNQGNTHLLLEILPYREVFEENFSKNYELCNDELAAKTKGENIHSRIFDNWVTILAGFRTLETSFDFGFGYRNLFNVCLEKMRYQNAEVIRSDEHADFWKIINSLHMSGRVVDGSHFRIEYKSKLKLKGQSEPIEFSEATPILYLNYDMVTSLLNARGTSNSNGMKIDLGSFQSYLRNSNSYLGIQQTRFKCLLANGMPDMEYKDNRKIAKEVRPNAMVFNYNILKEKYKLSLETYRSDETDFEEEDDEPDPPPQTKQEELPF